jgi:hypothetical protein
LFKILAGIHNSSDFVLMAANGFIVQLVLLIRKMAMRIFMLLLCALCGRSQAVVSAEGLRPNVSIVDYWRSIGEPSDYATRKTKFETRYNSEKYTGSEEQNCRWLAALVAENEDALVLAKRATAVASELAGKNLPGEKIVTSDFACPGWVPAEGFGINGSYGYNVRVQVLENKIEDKNVMVTLTGSVSNLGEVTTSGKVEVLVDGETKPLAEIPLVVAWFSTVGLPGTTTVYGKKGTSVTLPQGKKVSLRVTLNPAVKTNAGSVALWPCTRIIVLP